MMARRGLAATVAAGLAAVVAIPHRVLSQADHSSGTLVVVDQARMDAIETRLALLEGLSAVTLTHLGLIDAQVGVLNRLARITS